MHIELDENGELVVVYPHGAVRIRYALSELLEAHLSAIDEMHPRMRPHERNALVSALERAVEAIQCKPAAAQVQKAVVGR